MARRRWTSALYEFLRFGLKQAWACLFGGIAVFLMIATWWFYPAAAPLPRYDFLFLCMITVQAALLAGLETSDEAKVILIYHVVGTAMEIFKTQVGSWIYPEPNFFRVGGVPLFSGFMYACIGSYLCRAWRLFDFEFLPSSAAPRPGRAQRRDLHQLLRHHYIVDLRWLLFAWAGWLFFRTRVHFRVWRDRRSMPLLLGLVLVSRFIWLSENIGTFTKTWLYPSQRLGWSMVSIDKLGSWFLLLIISYTLVSLVNAPRERRGEEHTTRIRRRLNRACRIFVHPRAVRKVIVAGPISTEPGGDAVAADCGSASSGRTAPEAVPFSFTSTLCRSVRRRRVTLAERRAIAGLRRPSCRY